MHLAFVICMWAQLFQWSISTGMGGGVFSESSSMPEPIICHRKFQLSLEISFRFNYLIYCRYRNIYMIYLSSDNKFSLCCNICSQTYSGDKCPFQLGAISDYNGRRGGFLR